MKIDVFAEDGEDKELLGTYIISGIDAVANNDVSKKEGSSKPKVTLSFELTRTGILSLTKAEAGVEEIYYVEEKPKKKDVIKTIKTANATATNETE